MQGFYQLDLVTPVICPSDASLRKQSLQHPNFLMYALGRPHIGQRLYERTLNFCFRPALAISDFFATASSCCIEPCG
jgi:hypothetical protein